MIRILHGDCRVVLRTLPDAAFAACICDPPYHLTSIVKRFGSKTAAPAKHGTDGAFARASRGFMGQTWDGGDIAQDPDMWAEVLRVLKPGAHLAAFGGTRTFHRMACAIEDAGFEIRDTLMWLYASGFPKSHDVSKAIDKAAGHSRGTTPDTRNGPNTNQATKGDKFSGGYAGQIKLDAGSVSPEAAQWAGWGTALKPAYEPIILARKPLAGTVASNVLAHGCGALNIDACRVPASGRPQREVAPCRNDVTYNPNSLSGRMDGSLQSSRAVGATDLGRWPANVLHDGSPEVEAAFAAFGERTSGDLKPYTRSNRSGYAGDTSSISTFDRSGDSGTASRFFFTAKADASDRAGSKHPTVKPTALLRWLVQLVTPPGGAVLDPFAGSGSTGLAADQLGFDATLIEQDAEYVADIRRKIVGDAPLFAEVV